jgi:hypothetical protein
MPKVTKISYLLDSGSRVDYAPDYPEEIAEEAMSAIIQLMDGKDLIELANETADIQDRDF